MVTDLQVSLKRSPLSFGDTNTRDYRVPVLHLVEGDISPVVWGEGCRSPVHDHSEEKGSVRGVSHAWST